ncbi:MAG: CD1871A family CXXC motif-containing protein [bacterium]
MRLWKNKGIWLLGAGILFTLLGLLRGEAGAVLEKGISLCLQCMGLS